MKNIILGVIIIAVIASVVLFECCYTVEGKTDKLYHITCIGYTQKTWFTTDYEAMFSGSGLASSYNGVCFKEKDTGKLIIIYGQVLIEEQ